MKTRDTGIVGYIGKTAVEPKNHLNVAHEVMNDEPGCKHCYAAVMAKRPQAMRTPGYENGFKRIPATGCATGWPLQRKKPTAGEESLKTGRSAISFDSDQTRFPGTWFFLCAGLA